MSIAETPAASAGLEKWLPAFESSVGGRESVEVVETSLSWVLLAERHAYKIKKAVDLGEARFASPVRRRLACIEEVRLNRRLAAGVYLGVVPLTRDAAGGLKLGGQGDEVEWAVKMRRLRGDCNLQWLIEHGDLATHHVAAIGAALANFYFGSPPETVVLDDLCTRLRRRVDDVGKDIKPLLTPKLWRTVQQVTAAQYRYLDGARMVLNLRVCDGRVVDGHGDLSPVHVFLERQPVVIDCVEYSATRRRCDALDDLSALDMECQRLKRDDVAQALMSAYRDRTGDEPFSHLEAFYRSVHACARAKAAIATGEVDMARPTHSQVAKAASYLAQAEADAEIYAYVAGEWSA